jgi:hypothetical protein
MVVIYLLLLIGAAVCFGAAAFGRTTPRVNLTALGLLLWVLVPLIQTLVRVVD